MRTTLYTCCEALRVTALLLAAFLPRTAAEMLERLGAGGSLDTARLPADASWGGIRVGAETRKGRALFPRIETPEATASATTE